MEGQREINELHIPVGRPVKLTMTSEDVIHSFFVPAFRIKQDVVPGRYSTIWFTPTKPGKYHLFCAEYCGTNHSGMIGWVYVMEPRRLSRTWLSGGAPIGFAGRAGRQAVREPGLLQLPQARMASGRCPTLVGLLRPAACSLPPAPRSRPTKPTSANPFCSRTPRSWPAIQPLMPTFQGLVTEEGVLQLIEYIKSLGPQARRAVRRQRASPPARCPTNVRTYDYRGGTRTRDIT